MQYDNAPKRLSRLHREIRNAARAVMMFVADETQANFTRCLRVALRIRALTPPRLVSPHIVEYMPEMGSVRALQIWERMQVDERYRLQVEADLVRLDALYETIEHTIRYQRKQLEKEQ